VEAGVQDLLIGHSSVFRLKELPMTIKIRLTSVIHLQDPVPDIITVAAEIVATDNRCSAVLNALAVLNAAAARGTGERE
jgi:hypothetical protein